MSLNINLEQDDRICLNGCLIHKDLYSLLSARQEDERLSLLYNIVNMGIIAINSCTIKERVDNIIHKEIKSELMNEFNNFKEQISDTLTDQLNPIINSDPDKNNKIINNFINVQMDRLEQGLLNKMNNIENSIIEINTGRNVLKSTTGKGIAFEKRLVNYLHDIAAPLNDNVIDNTSKAGYIGRSKKGDFVIEIFNLPNYRFIIEAKSHLETNQMNMIDAEDYLNESLKNRKAQFIILLFEDDIPEKLQGIRFIGQNKLICRLEELQNSYNTAKQYLFQKKLYDVSVQMKVQSINEKKRENIPEITRSKIRIELKNIKQDLKNIENIQGNIEISRKEYINFSNKQLGNLKGSIDSFYYSISRKFNNIDNLLIIENLTAETVNQTEEKTEQTEQAIQEIQPFQITDQIDTQEQQPKQDSLHTDDNTLNDNITTDEHPYQYPYPDDVKNTTDNKIIFKRSNGHYVDKFINKKGQKDIDESW